MRIIQLKSNFGFIIVKKFWVKQKKNFSFLEYILYNLKLSKSKF